MKKYYIILVLISVILFLGLSISGGYPGHHVKFPASALVYCAFTFIVLSRNSERRVKFYSIVIILLPFLLIDLPIHLIDFNETLMSLPSTLASFIGVVFGILIYLSNKYLKIALSVLLIIGATWMAVFGYQNWLHKLNYGTYSGMISFKPSKPFEGIDQYGNHIADQDLKGKITLIDFWFTGCGICFSEFPDIQKLYDTYKNNPSILILAINKPIKKDTIGQAYAMIKERNFTFPTLIPANEELPEIFGVTEYPTIIIMDQTGTVIFRGSLKKAEKVLQRLIKNAL